MKKILRCGITLIIGMAVIFAIPLFPKAETVGNAAVQAETMNIIKVEGASVKLDGQEVTNIVPTEDNGKALKAPKYEVVLPKWGYGSQSYISVPVNITERGFLNVNAEAIDVNEMVNFSISSLKEPYSGVDKGSPDSLFTIGCFLNENNYNMTRGCSIFEPGLYYVKFFGSGMDLPQNFTFDVTFTKADGRALKNGEEIRTAGMDDSSVYYKVVTDKAGIIKLDYRQGKYTNNYNKANGGNFTLCNSKKKPVGKVQRIKSSGSLNWYAEKGTYYIRANVDDQSFGLKYTWHGLLKTPKVNKLKVMSKTISGTALKNTTVNVKIDDDTKIYTAKVDSKGKYTVNLKGKTVGYAKTYSVYLTDSKGRISKTVTAKL